MGPSPSYHVSCRMTMSVFPISLMKSGFLLFRPKADDLRPCIFQDERVKALCSIVSSFSAGWNGEVAGDAVVWV